MTAEPTEGFAMTSGIYRIENQINGDCYIGSAVNLQQRQGQHFRALRRGDHYNRHLQRAFAKYGESAFAFSVLEQLADPSQLIQCEQYFLDTLKPAYNISPTAGNTLGVRHTLEARRHMSEGHKGKPRSVKTCRKISEAMSGEGHPFYGKHHTEETKRKLSEAKKGERHPNYGKPRTEESRRKISEAMMGRQFSEEHRRKLSEANKARWRRFHAIENKESCLDVPKDTRDESE